MALVLERSSATALTSKRRIEGLPSVGRIGRWCFVVAKGWLTA